MQFSLTLVVVVLGTQSCQTLCDPMQPTRLLCPWNSPGKNTGVGCHSLLQGIFPTQGLNLGFLHCTWVSHIAGRFFTTWEAPFQPCFRIKIRVLTLKKGYCLDVPFFPYLSFLPNTQMDDLAVFLFSLSFLSFQKIIILIRILISDIFIVLGDCVISLVLSCTTKIWNSGPNNTGTL